jgi:hypothetical protein
MVEVGVGEEHSVNTGLMNAGKRDIGRDQVGPVDGEPWDEAQGEEVMDPAGVAGGQELLKIDGIFPEVLAEIQKDTTAALLHEDLVAADGAGAIIDGYGDHGQGRVVWKIG